MHWGLKWTCPSGPVEKGGLQSDGRVGRTTGGVARGAARTAEDVGAVEAAGGAADAVGSSPGAEEGKAL